MNSKKKIQLVLDEQAQKTLGELLEATGAASMAHVLRDALGVYDSLYKLLNEQGSNVQLAIVDRDRQELQELSVPSLQPRHIVPGTRSSLVTRLDSAREQRTPEAS